MDFFNCFPLFAMISDIFTSHEVITVLTLWGSAADELLISVLLNSFVFAALAETELTSTDRTNCTIC